MSVSKVGVYMAWFKRLLAGASLSTLVGCSAFGFAYNNLPSIASTWITVRFDLYDDQIALLDQQLVSLHRWHREHEIPIYIEQLTILKNRALEGNINEQALTDIFLASRQAYDRLIEHAAPLVATWLLSLYPNQPEQFKQVFDDQNEDYRDEYLNISDSHQRQSADLMLKRLERFYGDLTEGQLKLVEQWAKQKADYVQERYQRRLARQAQWLELIEKAANRQLSSTQISQQVVQLTALRPVNDDHRSMVALIAQAHQMAAPEQIEHAIRYVSEWVDNFTEVLPTSAT